MDIHRTSENATTNFLTLPPEIREKIYGILLKSANSRYEAKQEGQGPYYKYDLTILRVNRLINHEAMKVFQDNVFVKITTPYPEAISYVNSEGSVAFVKSGNFATDFQAFHLRILIDTPQYVSASAGSYSMITTLQDIPAFTRIWQFSNLNNSRQLNPSLTLRLDLKNPYNPGRNVPKNLQSALLLPFGMVKDLQSCAFDFHGSPFFDACEVYPSVKKQVQELQSQPTPSPEDCIAECLVHKTNANALVGAKSYIAALKEYFAAFEAIHIFISGRRREIHCDGYYATPLATGDYAGQDGHYVRIVLRVQLVANVVHTYLQLKEYEEAYFWGRRSILLFRRSMNVDPDEWEAGGAMEIGGQGWDAWVKRSAEAVWGAKREMGKLFWRTGIARREIGAGMREVDGKITEDNDGKEEVRALMWAASVYLPDDEVVKTEMQAMRVRDVVRERMKDMENIDGEVGD